VGASGVIVVSSATELCLIALTWIHGHCKNSTIIAGKLDFRYPVLTRQCLYSARVAFMNVERQLKLRKIPFKHVNPTQSLVPSAWHSFIQSSLANSVPALCVQSEHILSGAPAAEAAMPNIRVIPLNWWSHEKARVVTCVKLKYVQQPMGKTGMGSAVIRPSKRIIYDTREAIVSFLSEDVNSCVDEFLEEWARVSKMVVIAREGMLDISSAMALHRRYVYSCTDGQTNEME